MAWMRSSMRSPEERLSLQQGRGVQQLPLAYAHSRAKGKDRAECPSDTRCPRPIPDSSLADLYDPTLMPKELLQAHRQNDRAVMAAYGFSTKMTESECVAELFKRYSKLAE